LRKCPPVRQPARRICARVSAAAQRQGLVGMQLVPVVAIGITVVAVSRSVSAEAMQGVLVQSETMRADVAAADTNTTAEASHVFAATHAADVASAAKAAAHMAAAAKTSAVTAAAATAGVGRARQQA